MQRRSRKHAFTLMEILIVVAIIAILSAILFPVFSRVRENARSKNCMNNQRQIALAVLQYVQDNNRHFPPAEDPDNTEPEGWSMALGLNSPQLFQCPSVDHEDDSGVTDYWMNAGLFGPNGTGLHDVRLRYPANTILLGDGMPGVSGYALWIEAEPDAGVDAWEADSTYATRHLGGANYAFADGHVKWLKPDSIDTENPANGSNSAFLVR